MGGDRLMEPPQRFEACFVADRKGRVVHRDHPICFEIKSLNRLFGIHVNFPTAGAVVGTDWQKGGVDIISISDFSKSVEISGISGMVGGMLRHF